MRFASGGHHALLSANEPETILLNIAQWNSTANWVHQHGALLLNKAQPEEVIL